jgi:hypothetical protein
VSYCVKYLRFICGGEDVFRLEGAPIWTKSDTYPRILSVLLELQHTCYVMRITGRQRSLVYFLAVESGLPNALKHGPLRDYQSADDHRRITGATTVHYRCARGSDYRREGICGEVGIRWAGAAPPGAKGQLCLCDRLK